MEIKAGDIIVIDGLRRKVLGATGKKVVFTNPDDALHGPSRAGTCEQASVVWLDAFQAWTLPGRELPHKPNPTAVQLGQAVATAVSE